MWLGRVRKHDVVTHSMGVVQTKTETKTKIKKTCDNSLYGGGTDKDRDKDKDNMW